MRIDINFTDLSKLVNSIQEDELKNEMDEILSDIRNEINNYNNIEDTASNADLKQNLLNRIMRIMDNTHHFIQHSLADEGSKDKASFILHTIKQSYRSCLTNASPMVNIVSPSHFSKNNLSLHQTSPRHRLLDDEKKQNTTSALLSSFLIPPITTNIPLRSVSQSEWLADTKISDPQSISIASGITLGSGSHFTFSGNVINIHSTNNSQQLLAEDKLVPQQNSSTLFEDPILQALEKEMGNIPATNEKTFIGRENALQNLHEVLTDRSTVAITSHNTGAITHQGTITGLGGIGKTQLAIRYLHQYKENYAIRLWLQADTDLMGVFRRLARQLGIPVEESASTFSTQTESELAMGISHGIQSKKRPDGDIIQDVYVQLNTRRKPYLIVFDNAKDFNSIKKFLPPYKDQAQSSHGYILITSRAHEWDKAEYPLDVFTPEEAFLFIKHRLITDEASPLANNILSAAPKLAERLGHLPLALAQAVAYIKERKFSIEKYLATFNERRERYFEYPISIKERTDYDKTLKTTWSISFEYIATQSIIAMSILNICAYCNATAVPIALFKSLDSNEENVNDALFLLDKYSMIDFPGYSDVFHIHRLVQEVIQTQHKPIAVMRSYIQKTAALLENAYTYFDEIEYQFLPHLSALIQYKNNQELSDNELARRLVFFQGILRVSEGLFREGIEHYDEALSLSQNPQITHHILLKKFDALSYVSNTDGVIEEAEKLLNILPQNYHDILLIGRGRAYRRTGKYALAEKDLREAIRIIESNKKDVKKMLSAKIELGALYFYLNQLENAINILEETHKALIESFPQNFRLVDCLHFLGITYISQGVIDKGYQALNQARNKLRNQTTAIYADLCFGYAKIHYLRGEYASAIAKMKEAYNLHIKFQSFYKNDKPVECYGWWISFRIACSEKEKRPLDITKEEFIIFVDHLKEIISGRSGLGDASQLALKQLTMLITQWDIIPDRKKTLHFFNITTECYKYIVGEQHPNAQFFKKIKTDIENLSEAEPSYNKITALARP